jgi:hypothetical protein
MRCRFRPSLLLACIAGVLASGGEAAAAAQPSTPPGGRTACAGDAECPDESICENAFCRRIEQRVNIFYLYYQEGSFREVLGLYWSKRGATGFTVVAPIYWNYFSPTSHARVVAPFYWRFEDDAARSTLTVIVPGLPISWSRQPDARSFGVWPLFYKSTKFGWALPWLGSFKVANPDKGRAFGAIAFLYWWQRDPQGAFDLGFPIFVSSRSRASAFTYAIPLTFYWRTDDNARTLAIPFFYRHSWKTGASFYSWLGYMTRQDRQSSGSILWLYWFAREQYSQNAHDVLFPLFWSFRGANRGTTVFFPVIWDFRGPDSRTTVAGPVVHLRDGPSWLNVVVPLWWSGGNSGKPSRTGKTDKTDNPNKADQTATAWRFQTLIPLFFWKQSGNGSKLTWLSLIGGGSRDDQAHERTLALLPGLFFRRDPERELDIVTPLYIRHHNIAADATTRLISALLYLRDDPGGSTTVVFPIFWRFRDRPTGATATAVFPFFFNRSGPSDTTTAAGFFPIWFYQRKLVDGGWGAGVFPLAFFGRRGDASHAVVFPLFWRFADAKGSTTLLLPLFYSTRDGSGRDSAVLPLLTFFGTHDGLSYQIQFPLFWRFTDARTRTTTAITPIGFVGRSPEGWRAGVGPIVPLIWAAGGGPRRHFVLFPLVWHFEDDGRQESTTVVATFLHRRRGGEITDALFPLLYYRRGARPGGTHETSFTALLFHYHRDATTRVWLTPIGGSITGPRRSGGFLGPYLWYRGPTIAASGIPFLYADITRTQTGERTRQWGPVFAIDGPDHQALVLLPIFGRYHDARETDTYVFPSYFRQRKPDGYSVDTLLPLFWHSRWRDRTTTVIGNWYGRRGPEVHNTGLVPVYFWAKNPSRTLLCIPPLLTFHRHDFQSDSAVTWVGLFYRSHSRTQDATVLFPFWWSGRDGQRRHRVLGPLYWHFENEADASAWTLAALLYWSHQGTLRTRALLPVAWYTRDDAKQSGSNAVMPLFYSSYGPNRSTLLTLLAGIIRSETARRWYILPVYVSNTVDSRTRAVFPVYLSHFDKASDTRTRVFVPLLHFSRQNPEKSFSTWVGLFWRRTDVASATTLVLPLFFDVHDYRASRTTLFLPLLVRYANETTGDSIWLAPLFYRHSAPKESTTVAFPLFWDFKHEDRRTTLLLPLFAHWTRPTHAGTYVFPIFYYRKGFAVGAPPGTPDGTWRVFVPPLFDAAVQRPGDLRWEVLGGLFGKERIGRNHYLKIFFFTIETQKASAAQTSWYGQPRRASRAHPVRGLATNGW